MAALVGKCFVIFDGFFSHGSAATALNLKCYFDVAAFETPGFRRVFLLCNYLFALKRLSALTPASLCRQCGVPALPAGLVEREGGMPQLLISSVSGSFSQPKAYRAGGG